MGVETELLGLKNRYDGKEFRVIEREDGTIAVLAGDTVIVDSGVTPVTAIPSAQGVGELKAGAVIIPTPPVSGNNRLLKVQPTPYVRPLDEASTPTWTNTTLTAGATVTADPDASDPLSGLGCARLVMGTSTSDQRINYNTQSPISLGTDDLIIVPVWCDHNAAKGSVAVRVSSMDVPTGFNWRMFSWAAHHLRYGWNILICKNTEEFLGTTEYGVVKDRAHAGVWNAAGVDSPTAQIRSVSVFARQSVEGATYKFGGVYFAPKGYCKGAIMWSADDVPHEFLDLAIPIIESYGWRTTLNSTSQHTARASKSHITLSELRDLAARGHEVWGHTRYHERMSTSDLTARTRALTQPRDFFAENGFPLAARCMAWPYLDYDADAIALAKSLGYKMATGGPGSTISPLATGSAFTVGRTSVEYENAWYVDTFLNGAIKRGEGMITYMHKTFPGGDGSNTYPPGGTAHYADHLRRWCDLVADREARGECEVLTVAQYYRACGIDIMTHPFTD